MPDRRLKRHLSGLRNGPEFRELRQRYKTARDQQRVLNQLLDEQQMRLGMLLAENERLRDRPEHDRYDRLNWLFIMTYGRSGSTLLQGLLSRAPGVLVRGENGGILEHLFRFHSVATHNRDRLAGAFPRDSANPWWGIDGYPAQVALRDLRNLVCDTLVRPLPDTTTAGFKEIRWPTNDLRGYVDFLRQVFPGAKFVFNTRDLRQTSQSGFWAKEANAMERLEAEEQRLRAMAEELGDDCFHVHYNDFVADPRVLEPLFDWAGLTFNEYELREALERPHSYDNKNV